jgi:hypothetical protein
MTRRTGIAALAACLAACALGATAGPAAAHSGSPDMLSKIRSVTPTTKGVEITVLNRDDRMLLHNTSGKEVVIEGYTDEPYARVKADGTVQVNTKSEAYYLNQDREGMVDIPAGVGADVPPRWKEVAKTGRFEWHDHRMHWMGQGRPPQVKDPSVRTKILDYDIPIEVGGKRGAIAGTLLWTPEPGGNLPMGAILAFAALLIALCIGVIIVRRRAGEADAEGETEATRRGLVSRCVPVACSPPS